MTDTNIKDMTITLIGDSPLKIADKLYPLFPIALDIPSWEYVEHEGVIKSEKLLLMKYGRKSYGL